MVCMLEQSYLSEYLKHLEYIDDSSSLPSHIIEQQVRDKLS